VILWIEKYVYKVFRFFKFPNSVGIVPKSFVPRSSLLNFQLVFSIYLFTFFFQMCWYRFCKYVSFPNSVEIVPTEEEDIDLFQWNILRKRYYQWYLKEKRKKNEIQLWNSL